MCTFPYVCQTAHGINTLCVCVCLLLCCSPLDELIDLLGGVERVAEMTGRQARIVRRGASGRLVYEVRDARGSGATLESVNNLEVNRGTLRVLFQ